MTVNCRSPARTHPTEPDLNPPKALQMTGPDGKPLVLFDNVFPATPSGRIELKSETLAKRWGAAPAAGLARAEASYPLMLISPASDKRDILNLGGLAGSRKAPALLMNPEDAAQAEPRARHRDPGVE